MSGDPEQEYFSDGLTEDIITALTHWRQFPVIARNSCFVFKNKVVVEKARAKLGYVGKKPAQFSRAIFADLWIGCMHQCG